MKKNRTLFAFTAILMFGTNLIATEVNAQKYLKLEEGKGYLIMLPDVMNFNNGSVNEVSNPDLYVVLKLGKRLSHIFVYSRSLRCVGFAGQ